MSTEFESVKLSIVLPTYNERENLNVLVCKLGLILGKSIDYEIIIVDDSSPDGTGHVADELSTKYGHIIVLHRPGKMGLSSALIDGLKKSEGDFIAFLDADLQHSPKMLDPLLNEIKNGADLAIASRYVNGGSIRKWNLWRRIISLGATLLARALLSNVREVKDPLSGYFIFKRNVVNVTELSGFGWKILLEILANVKCKRIVEVPYMFESRLAGKSKLRIKDFTDYLYLIFKLKRSNG